MIVGAFSTLTLDIVWVVGRKKAIIVHVKSAVRPLEETAGHMMQRMRYCNSNPYTMIGHPVWCLAYLDRSFRATHARTNGW